MQLRKLNTITIANCGISRHVKDNQVPRTTQAKSIFEYQVTINVKGLMAYTTTIYKRQQQIQK